MKQQINTESLLRTLPCVMRRTEQELNDLQKIPTHYLLPGNRINIATEDHQELRNKLASLAQQVTRCDNVFGAQKFGLRPPLVACFKQLNLGINEELSAYKARVVFDLDPVDKHLDTSAMLTREWFIGFREILATHVDMDVNGSSIAAFVGSFADKKVSCHLYFPDWSWSKDERNANVPDITLRALNEYCRTANLEVDKSILSSGLKLPYCDKRVTGGWRNDVASLVYYSEKEVVTWKELFNNCDPLVNPIDLAYDNELNWIHADEILSISSQVPRAATGATGDLEIEELTSVGDGINERLHDLVTQWVVDEHYRVYRKKNHSVWVPRSKYCPFIKRDHGHVKTFISINDVDNCITIACHSSNCANRRIVSRAQCAPVIAANELAAVEWGNTNFAQVNIVGGNGNVNMKIMQYPTNYKDKIKYFDVKTFHDAFQHKFFTEKVGKRFVKRNYTKVWLESTAKIRFEDGLIFEPRIGAPPQMYNIFRGWNASVLQQAENLEEQFGRGAVAIDEKCELFTDHLFLYICNSNIDLYKYVLRWIWFLLMKAELKPTVALVISGVRGSGKSTLYEYIRRIVGDHHSLIYHQNARVGSKFNDQMAYAKLVCLDEAVGESHKKHESLLKGLLTSDKIQAEAKYMPTQQIDSYHSFMIFGNEQYTIPTGTEARRFMVMDAVKPPDPSPYFNALYAELEGDGPAAFYSVIRNLAIPDDWHPRDIVFTDALFRQIYFSLSPPERYVCDSVAREMFVPEGVELSGEYIALLPNDEGVYNRENCFDLEIPVAVLYKSFSYLYPASTDEFASTNFGCILRNIGKHAANTEIGMFRKRRTRSSVNGARYSVNYIPSKADCMIVLSGYIGCPFDIFEGWCEWILGRGDE